MCFSSKWLEFLILDDDEPDAKSFNTKGRFNSVSEELAIRFLRCFDTVVSLFCKHIGAIFEQNSFDRFFINLIGQLASNNLDIGSIFDPANMISYLRATAECLSSQGNHYKMWLMLAAFLIIFRVKIDSDF